MIKPAIDKEPQPAVVGKAGGRAAALPARNKAERLVYRHSPLETSPTAPAGRRSWWPCCPNISFPPFLSPLTLSARRSCTPSGSFSLLLSFSLSVRLSFVGRSTRARRIRRDTMRGARHFSTYQGRPSVSARERTSRYCRGKTLALVCASLESAARERNELSGLPHDGLSSAGQPT